MVLNGLRIPLSEFAGVDLADLDAIELRFGAATPAGSIQLADVAFQEPPVTAAAPSPTVAAAAPKPLAGAKRVDAIAVGGVTTVPSSTVCADTAAPRSSIASLRLAGGRLVASGVASDAGCAARSGKAAREGKLARVQISVERRTAGGCRYLHANGKLTAARSCSAPLALIAKGAKRWSLKSAARLPGGTYTVRVQAITRTATSSARGSGHSARTDPGHAAPAQPPARPAQQTTIRWNEGRRGWKNDPSQWMLPMATLLAAGTLVRQLTGRLRRSEALLRHDAGHEPQGVMTQDEVAGPACAARLRRAGRHAIRMMRWPRSTEDWPHDPSPQRACQSASSASKRSGMSRRATTRTSSTLR